MSAIDPTTIFGYGGVALVLFLIYVAFTTEGLGWKFIIAIVVVAGGAALAGMGFGDFLHDAQAWAGDVFGLDKLFGTISNPKF